MIQLLIYLENIFFFSYIRKYIFNKIYFEYLTEYTVLLHDELIYIYIILISKR